MRSWTLAGWLAAVWWASVSTASANDIRFELVAAGALGIDANDRCEREASDVVCHRRLGGLLKYYDREAA